jgi:hypothetical protein
MLNFPQAVAFTLALLPSLATAEMAARFTGSRRRILSVGAAVVTAILSPGGVLLLCKVTGAESKATWDTLMSEWLLLGNWFVPLVLGVYLPLQIASVMTLVI